MRHAVRISARPLRAVGLAVLVALAAALAQTGPGSAAAAGADNDWESFVCTEGGGVYVDRPDGGWECAYPDGSKIVCDAGESPDRDECETSGPGFRPLGGGQPLAPGASTVLAPSGGAPKPSLPSARRNAR